MFTLKKTVSDGSSPAGFSFTIRTGASTAEDDFGTILASGTTTSSGFTSWSLTAAGAAAGMSVQGASLVFLPGTYQLCESNLHVAWHSSIEDMPGFFVPDSENEIPDNSLVCAPITIGSNLTITVVNRKPPQGDARTIGYWKNWSSCTGGNQAPITDQVLASFAAVSGQSTRGVFIGTRFIDTCPEAVALLGKSDIASGQKRAGDAAYGLAAQLLAAKLNVQKNAASCSAATSAITSGQNLLKAIGFNGVGEWLPSNVTGTKATQRSQATYYAGILDRYNNNELCP
jgi:hypothetical protein